ncbi:MAG: CHC2 zinc finger domain-containing protein, partial [Planctomycetota bacterium]
MTQFINDNSDRDRVRDASDIVKVIGEHIDLKPRGREYVGLCPFHNDNKPSMYVVPHKQIYTCFSCGAAGDIFKFVMDYHQ